MAAFNPDHDVTRTLDAAQSWFRRCMVDDQSVFSDAQLWITKNIDELFEVFVGQPDAGSDTFYTKLERQMLAASPAARQLMAEMLWVILLFQSRISSSQEAGGHPAGVGMVWERAQSRASIPLR